MIYKWREGTRLTVKAQVAGERIERIQEQHGGAVTPQAVVDDARDKHSPLHPVFTWDNAQAAALYRLEQARNLLNHLVVVVESESREPQTVKALVNLSQQEERAYFSTVAAMSQPSLRAQILSRALRELDTWRDRYRELEELASVFRAAEQVREEITV